MEQWKILGGVVLVMGLSACASDKTPATADVAVSREAVAAATSAGAADLAPAEMQSAREKLMRANQALAAKDCSVPFYAAVPSPTIDWDIRDALREIPIEERGAAEVLTMQAVDAGNRIANVRIMPDGTRTANPAFDVTPARLVTGIITDRGIATASREGLQDLYRKRVA